MNNEIKEKMKNSILDFRLPRYSEITNVGLYLEQTVKFINSYLAPLGEPELTTSMVSNYVKNKLIASPEKKQYYTEHIAYLMFIAVTKTVISLDDIRMMIAMQKEEYPVNQVYDYFCDEFENLLKYTFGFAEVEDKVGELETDSKDLLRNVIVAAVHKIYLDKYLEAFRTLSEKDEK